MTFYISINSQTSSPKDIFREMYTNVSRVRNRENDDFEKCLAVIYTNGPRRIPKVRGKRQERFAVLQSVKTSDIRSIMQQ